jgi:hypothetical protein
MVDFSALFKKKEDPKEYYFGLFLRGDSAVGFLFEIKDGMVSQIAKETCKYSNGWEGILDDIDELLSVLENETQIHIDQCIFFVYSYFIDQETQEIKEPYKDVIKSISKELELKPMGYIECHEAVKDMLEKKGSIPLNCVLVELDHNHLSYYVYKGGKMIHSDQTPRTDSVVDDLSELFAKNKDHFLLPSKVILYGSSLLEKEAAEIKENTWEKDLFIQSPRVSTVKNEDVLNGLSQTFMEQIKKDMSGDEAADQAEEQMIVDKQAAAREEAQADEEGEEIAQESAKAPVIASKKPEPSDDGIPDEAESLGFAIGADVAEEGVPEISTSFASTASENTGIHMETEAKASLTDRLPKFKIPEFKMPNIDLGDGVASKVAIGAAVVLILVSAGGLLEFNFHKAQIEIDLPSDKISDKFDLQAALTATGEGDFKVEQKTISKTQKKSIATSGQRDVGDKAKGKVIIHNFSDDKLSLNSGVVLTVDNLKYTLDSDVSVASQSEKIEGGRVTKDPGTANASVTASAIGTEYNISKDKRLSISGLSSSNYFGLASDNFSGGSKKTLKTVAKKDLDALEKEVLDSQKEGLLDAVKSQLGDHENVISDLTEIKLGKENFSGEVGQEASEVSLSADVDIYYYVFDDTNLKKEVADRLKKNVPSGFEIDKNKLAYNVDNTDKKGGSVDMNVKGEATVVKTIDKKKALSSITGKSLDETRRILKEQFSAEDIVIKGNSSPLFLNSILPFSTKNIEVSLKSE